MEQKTILITGIGGNVGQGIIRNILESKYPIRIIGTNVTDFSAGNHFVDAFYKVPFGFEPEFIPTIKKIVKLEKVDLIIPSTDFESFYLSINSKSFECSIATAGPKATESYLDKFISWELHKRNNIPFSESILPSFYNNNFVTAIAKPRKGRGSKGIIENISSLNQISLLDDNDYIIQKMHRGLEITTAAYVSYKSKKLLGIITMERSLESGATTYCKVIREYDTILWEIAVKITQCTDMVGSFNIQSIVDENNVVHPFEINCRISGTNSIRSHFGFKDVLYAIDELLYNKEIADIKTTDGIAYRYLSDVIYPFGINNGNNTDNFIVF
ncbi:MAG: hypothetical protein PSX81_13455 [bacterium]|nr:hypothetical protein [bacterium]